MENESLSNFLLIVCGGIAILVIIWRITSLIVQYVRTAVCLTNDTQRYFARPSRKSSWLKKNILYAPLFSKRHNREFQLSSAINMGTLPTRFQFAFLIAYLGLNIAFCVINIPWTESFEDAARQVRNRSGTLATVNLIPLYLMAGRNNPLIRLLGISFDTFNLLHRWFGRIVVLEAVCHALAFWAGSASKKGWAAAFKTSYSVPYMLFGLVSVFAMGIIFFQAASVARHAYYEVFKVMHILLAIAATVGLFYHLDMKGLSAIKWLIPAIAIWGGDRFLRFAHVIYRNIGNGGTQALVETLPDNAIRGTVTMARPWTFRPGQHAYLYMPTISFWQSHPFSLAWSDESQRLTAEKLAMNKQDVLAMRHTTMSFIIRARTGMTTLYQRAAASYDGRMTTRCLVEGPYGGEHSMHSYGSVVLFAGGVGITHAVPHIRDLVAGYANGTVAARKIVLVWIIQTPEHLEWIRPWMTEILAMDRRREVLKIMLFVSRPRSTKEIHSPSSTVQMFPGRPNIETLLAMETEQQVGAMGVSVCGPGSLSDDVRLAVRRRQGYQNIDFIEEAFSW